MKISASVTDLVRNFSDYINRVVYRRERFVLVRGGRPVAELSPLPSATRLRDLPELMASLPGLDDAEAQTFARDVEAARRELEARSPEDHWES